MEAGVQGVQLHTQYLAAFFHKLSGKKNFFKIGQNLTKLEGKSVVKSDVILRTVVNTQVFEASAAPGY